MESSNPFPPDLVELNEKFRDAKHSINNSLAVIMALAELAQRNPSHFHKLADAVLARSPEILAQLRGYQTVLSKKLGLDENHEG